MMPEPQAVLRLLHILLAIVAVGANLTYALWLRQAERDPAHLAYTIRGIRWIDRHVANPAYALALLLIGGLTYTAGAALYALRWPDPWPRTFGYHEVFHLLTVVAAVAFYIAIVAFVLPAPRP